MNQTVMTISMINNNVNNNGEQHMTSLEIAQLTGKQHKDVLKAIRNMESAWTQIAGRKFALGSYEDTNGRRKMASRLVWTEKGREFVLDLIRG